MKSQPGLLTPPTRVRVPTLLLPAVAALLASLVAFVRLPPTSRGVVWAEDGGIFLRDAMTGGPLLDIFTPYDGYLHVLPRLAAKAVVGLFRIDDYGFAMNFLSCLVTGGIAVAVFYCAKELTSDVFIRGAWASITVLVAPAPLETLANFANIHSYLLWLTPWLLLRPARTRAAAVLLFVSALAVSLTEIAAVLFLPMFALRFRDRSLWWARLGLSTGLACQAIATIYSPRAQPETYPLNFPSIVAGWFLNGPAALVYGNAATIIANVLNFGLWPIAAASLPFAAALGFVLWKGTRQQKILGLVFLYASFGVWVLTQVVNFKDYFDYASFDAERWMMFFLSRYSTVPSMFILALLPLAALSGRSHFRRASAALLGAFLVLQAVHFFPQNTARNNGPDWQESVNSARAACISNPTLAVAPVSIAPENWLAGGLAVQCNALKPASP